MFASRLRFAVRDPHLIHGPEHQLCVTITLVMNIVITSHGSASLCFAGTVAQAIHGAMNSSQRFDGHAARVAKQKDARHSAMQRAEFRSES